MPAKQSQTAETPVQATQADTEIQSETQLTARVEQLSAWVAQLERRLAQTPRQTLTIGRIVHFVSADGSERAAMVTWVYHEGNERPGEVDLAVFTTAEEHGRQGAVYGYGNASYDAGGTTPNTWHWPAEGTPHPEQLSPNSWSSSDSDSAENSLPENSGATGAS